MRPFALLAGIAVLLFWGMYMDLAALPPPMGARCHFAEVDVRESSPDRGEPPPRVEAPSEEAMPGPKGVGAFPLGWEQLSPRMGFGLTVADDPETWARRLGAGWYLDWRALPRYPEQKPEHWQMIRLGRGCVYPQPEAIRWLAARFPGNVWVIGNEPDNPWQDNVTPEEYAQVYHRLYVLIKGADPRAKVAVAGVTQATPLRMAYLDRVLAAYQALYAQPMPVDWWTVHGFVLREERGGWGAGIPPGFPAVDAGALYPPEAIGDVELLKAQIIAFRAWMAGRGYRDVPLAITEFGVLAPAGGEYPPDVMADYLREAFSWLATARDPESGLPADDDLLVQRWAWFSLYDPLYPASNLGNVDGDGLTATGWAFRRFVLSEAR